MTTVEVAESNGVHPVKKARGWPKGKPRGPRAMTAPVPAPEAPAKRPAARKQARQAKPVEALPVDEAKTESTYAEQLAARISAIETRLEAIELVATEAGKARVLELASAMRQALRELLGQLA